MVTTQQRLVAFAFVPSQVVKQNSAGAELLCECSALALGSKHCVDTVFRTAIYRPEFLGDKCVFWKEELSNCLSRHLLKTASLLAFIPYIFEHSDFIKEVAFSLSEYGAKLSSRNGQ